MNFNSLLFSAVIFLLIVILITIRQPKTYNTKHYTGEPHLVTGTLNSLGFVFEIIYENATLAPIQRVEEDFTEVYFGSGSLIIKHNPLEISFYPDTNEGLKLTVTDLISTNNRHLYYGALTEADGLPKNIEIWYQGINSKALVGGTKTEKIVSFLLGGAWNTIFIYPNLTTTVDPKFKEYITLVNLND